jgi:hypothetical protein
LSLKTGIACPSGGDELRRQLPGLAELARSRSLLPTDQRLQILDVILRVDRGIRGKMPSVEKLYESLSDETFGRLLTSIYVRNTEDDDKQDPQDYWKG